MKLILIYAVIVSVTLGQSSKRQKLYHNDGTLSECNCGSRNNGRIVGGKETLQNEYPWMVVLQCGLLMCGGSVITQFHVLTAAHCTLGLEPDQIIMVVGSHNISNPFEGIHYRVAEIIQHEEFKEKPLLHNDISIVVTRSQIRFYRNAGPVCLPTKRFRLEKKELKVTGWGATKGTGNGNILHEADLRFVSLDKCQRLWPDIGLKETFLCAQEDKKDVCIGDSGGPVVYFNPDNRRYTQVALVSFTELQCESLAPIVNTDIFSFIGWIIAAISGSKPGVKACAGN